MKISQSDKKSYDDEPVYFCKRCLSLNIRQVRYVTDIDYCEDCGAADIGTASIEEWDALYRKKYGISFIEVTDKKK